MPIPNWAKVTQFATALLLTGLCLSGCNTLHPASYTSPVSEQFRRSVHSVAVVPLDTEAAGEFSPLAGVGAAEAARRGMGTGAVAGVGAGVQLSLATGPLAPAAAAIFVPISVVVGAVGGGVVGAIAGVPASVADTADAALAPYRNGMSRLLAQRVALLLPSTGKEVVNAVATAPDARLEVAVNRWGLVGGTGADPLMQVFAAVSWRALAGPNAGATAFRKFVVEGPRRRMSDWTADDNALLRSALDQVLGSAAEAITESAFLVQNFHVAGNWALDWACGLQALSPGDARRITPIPLALPRASSLSPALRWEPFPRERDRQTDEHGLLARLSQVRYDLRVWKAEVDKTSLAQAIWQGLQPQAWLTQGRSPGELVYERRSLELPVHAPELAGNVAQATTQPFIEHPLDVVLAPDTVYLWTVRARFVLDGAQRVTPWSRYRDAAAHPVDCAAEIAPASSFYVFRTP